MAGGWRISEEEELRALRRARLDARRLRTEDSWNHFVLQAERCERLGLLDADHDVDVAASRADAPRADAPPVVDLDHAAAD